MRMRVVAMMVGLTVFGATGAQAAPAKPMPTLESMTVGKGVARAAEIEALVKHGLAALADCPAVAKYRDSYFVRLKDLAAQDDRVKVIVRSGTSPPPLRLDFDIEANGALSDEECIATAVNGWGWSDDDRELPSGQEIVRFTYRFRPDDEARQRITAERQATFNRLCGLVATAARGNLDASKDDLMQALAQPKTTFEAVLFSTTYSALLGDLSRVRLGDGRPGDVLAATLRELAAQYGLHRCEALSGWSPLDVAEVLDAPGMPRVGCAERVKQLRSLKVGVAPMFNFEVTSARAQPAPTNLFLLDFGARNANEYRPPRAAVKALADGEARLQKKKRPVAYVFFPSFLAAREVVDIARWWSVDFELRMLVARTGLAPPKLARAAWPEAVALFNKRFARTQKLTDVMFPAFDEDEHCKPTGEFHEYAFDAKLAAPERAAAYCRTVADELEHCGCPDGYAEVAFARAMFALDQAAAQNGYLPLRLTDDPKAPLVRLPDSRGAAGLAAVLRDEPIRIEFSAD